MKILDLKKIKDFKLADLYPKNIVRFVWSAILDDHVCELCRSLDGHTINATDPEYYMYQPPLHPRCRCSWHNITSDTLNIPEVSWNKPKQSLIDKYAPFLFIIPIKWKNNKVPIEIAPFAPEAPEMVFNPNDVIDIEEYIKEQQIRIVEEMGKEYEGQ